MTSLTLNVMKHSLNLDSAHSSNLTRREAIKRTAAMLGIALTPSLIAGIARAQTNRAAGAADAPKYLNAKQASIAGAVAERILPRTDTPGARDVGVPAFLDLMYGEFMTPEEKQTFARGLDEVESASRATHQRDFAQVSPEQQDKILHAIAEASQAKEKTFFHLMKDLTLLGYFTSEEVGRNVTHYDPIPGKFQGCIPLADVGNKAWTR